MGEKVRKYLQEGTSLLDLVIPELHEPQNNEAVRQQLDTNPANLNGRRNGLGLTQTALRRIVRLYLGWYPYKINAKGHFSKITETAHREPPRKAAYSELHSIQISRGQTHFFGGQPDMGCCKRLFGINVFMGPPSTT